MSENVDLNEEVVVIVEDAEVITTPIDDTLSISGDAADAKAVGAALALKADKSELSAAITVNGQSADAQGAILVNGTDIQMSSTDSTTLKAAIEAVDGKTGANIPVNGDPGAATIAQAIAAASENSVQVTNNTLQLTGEITDQSYMMANLQVGNTVLPVKDVDAVKSVNNVLPGSSGNVQISTVDAARQLVTSNAQMVEGIFVRRTAGGNASIGDGAAWLGVVRGNSVHTGYSEESFDLTVTSSAAEPITAEITNQATFRTQAEEGGTYTFTYSGSWDTDPSTWGITVTGTPTSGDVITVVWTEEVRGTITPADPTAFVATGWNLYNNTVGYARVLKYSDEYNFGISGAYTALKYSATESGTQTTITPVNGVFSVPGDGYVHVTGGNGTTAIWMQQSDWSEGYDGSFQAYTEDEIDLSGVMTEFFPNGLCSVGDVRDEINLNTQEAIVRIERMEYTAENLAAVIAAERAYDADEDYIYAVYLNEDMPDPEDIDLDGAFTANDHGMEFFEGTAVGAYAQILYGENLIDKLRTDVVTISAQTLETAQKSQVRTNIGAASQEDVETLNNKWTDAGNVRLLSNGNSTLDQLVEKIGNTNINGITVFGLNSSNANTLTGKSGAGIGIAKNMDAGSAHVTIFQVASGILTMGVLTLSTKAFTVTYQTPAS